MLAIADARSVSAASTVIFTSVQSIGLTHPFAETRTRRRVHPFISDTQERYASSWLLSSPPSADIKSVRADAMARQPPGAALSIFRGITGS